MSTYRNLLCLVLFVLGASTAHSQVVGWTTVGPADWNLDGVIDVETVNFGSVTITDGVDGSLLYVHDVMLGGQLSGYASPITRDYRGVPTVFGVAKSTYAVTFADGDPFFTWFVVRQQRIERPFLGGGDYTFTGNSLSTNDLSNIEPPLLDPVIPTEVATFTSPANTIDLSCPPGRFLMTGADPTRATYALIDDAIGGVLQPIGGVDILLPLSTLQLIEIPVLADGSLMIEDFSFDPALEGMIVTAQIVQAFDGMGQLAASNAIRVAYD